MGVFVVSGVEVDSTKEVGAALEQEARIKKTKSENFFMGYLL